MDLANHWNQVYSAESVDQLGFYEVKPEPSLALLEKCALGIEDRILDMGAGASTFLDYLIEKGFQNLSAVDISAIALEKHKTRLGKEKASRVAWIAEDVTQPTRLTQIKDIALWHDRAMLHFLTKEEHRQAYRRLLLKSVRPGGYVIIAAFSPQGAKQCSGLKVHRYDQNSLAEFLGKGFELREWFDYLYTMPSGDHRPYIYTLFQRQSSP
jgi:SAM-dependent methyltransferase